jgi:hypothetical protein
VRFSLRHFNYAKADARGIEIGWLGWRRNGKVEITWFYLFLEICFPAHKFLSFQAVVSSGWVV